MRRGRAIPALAALAVSLTACGSDQTPPGGSGAGGLSAKNADNSASMNLFISNRDDMGWFITDSEGLPLYRFDKDTPKPSKSNCEGECAKTWKPVPADKPVMATGVDPISIGTLARPDGTKQLTIAGYPQYTFAEDKVAGDMKGQGKGGTWWVTAPNGAKITGGKTQNNTQNKSSSTPSTSPSPTGDQAPPPAPTTGASGY
jgi:predicted lipoprotein with Yx(FWY)xxD motif